MRKLLYSVLLSVLLSVSLTQNVDAKRKCVAYDPATMPHPKPLWIQYQDGDTPLDVAYQDYLSDFQWWIDLYGLTCKYRPEKSK